MVWPKSDAAAEASGMQFDRCLGADTHLRPKHVLHSKLCLGVLCVCCLVSALGNPAVLLPYVLFTVLQACRLGLLQATCTH